MSVSVYQYYDCTGNLLYVGVTSRGYRRTNEHAETKDWWTRVTGCAIEHFATRELALEREKFLINRYSPPFNSQHNLAKAAAKALDAERAHSPSIKTSLPLTPKSDDFDFEKDVARKTARWYRMPPEQRKTAVCVRCGERPGNRGPQCIVCKPPKKIAHAV